MCVDNEWIRKVCSVAQRNTIQTLQNMVELEIILLNVTNQTQKEYSIWSHWLLDYKKVNLTEIESRLAVMGVQRGTVLGCYWEQEGKGHLHCGEEWGLVSLSSYAYS